MNWLFTSVLTVALVGFMFTARTLIARATHVSADTIGLHSQTGSKTMLVPWGAIERVEMALNSEGDRTFKVIGRDGQTITWNAGHERRFAPSPGTQRVTAEELAAIVVQRSGKPLSRASAE